jgi:hypothetical protein
MPKFTQLTKAEKNDLLLRASSRLNISPILLEKDFWVSWLLNKIFQDGLSKDITFKGGTSLSKCYGIISRFSEDIDLTIDRKIFNEAVNEKELSNKGLKKLIESNDHDASDFVNQQFKPMLEKSIKSEIGEAGWEILPDADESKNLRFFYPSAIEIIPNSYVKQSILIELGARGEINPYEMKAVTSYTESLFPEILEIDQADIRTLSPVRTFWEKVTLLHAENHRPKDKIQGDRLSRHYYDVHQLITAGVSDVAIGNIDLLLDVIDHKKKYFRSAWAQYETAIPETIKIVPHSALQKMLSDDYGQMESMIFGEIPSFQTILDTLQNFEKKVNDSGL